MLRILDSGAGSYVTVTPAQPGLLRVRAEVPLPRDPQDITAQRILLVADVLFRTAELAQTQALVAWAFRGPSAEQTTALVRTASALNIHPPAETSLSLADVHVIADGAAVPRSTGRTEMLVAAAHLPDEHSEHDPLAVRLALLSWPYHQPAVLTGSVLADAWETLSGWRHQVALWAESPSRPTAEPVAADISSAFDDLDSSTVLTLLRGLASDDGIPAGARFETFMLADRILGLDLARDIGKVRRQD